jgi:hypothetical protein
MQRQVPMDQLAFFPWVYEMAQKKQADTATDIYTRTKKRKTKPSYQLRELDIEILNHVREYYLLTAWQLVALRYSPGSMTFAQTRLQILSGNKDDTPSEGYLRRRGLWPLTFGNTVQLYYLGTPAINELLKLGYTITTRHRRIDKIQEMSYPPLIHTLNVNDVLIAGRNLSKAAPDIRLDAFLHDFDLQMTPAVVEFERKLSERSGGGVQQERVKIVPDGMLDFRLRLHQADAKERRRIILSEIDRGTETNIEEFKKKIRAYVHYALPGGAFEEMFGRTNKRVVWIVTKGGENRLWTLRKWCEEELAEQELDHEYNLFRFTLLEQVKTVEKQTGREKLSEELAVDPFTFFLTPVAYLPYHREPDTLLWKP